MEIRGGALRQVGNGDMEIRGGALRQVGNGHIRLIISGRIPKRRKNAEDEKFCLGCLFVFNR